MGYFFFFRKNAPWLISTILLTFTSSYGQTFFISIFAGEIRQDFNLTHGAWGVTYTVGTATSALVMVWAGMLTDRLRVRLLAPVVLGMLVIACLAMATISQVWMLIPVIFLLRLSGQGMTSHIAMVATARWFTAARGRALSITSLGFSFGNAVLPLIFVALLSVISWRYLWGIAAGLTVLVIPVLLIMLRQERTPQSISTGSENAGIDQKHWTRKMLLRHWLFWLMVPTLLGPATWSTSLFFQQVHLSEVKGWTHLEFVSLFPIFTAVMIVTTIAIGPGIDRFGANRIMPVYLWPFAISFIVISLTGSLVGAAIGMAIMGLGAGLGNTLVSAFWAEHIGTRHLGSVKSMATAIMVLGSAIGPGITGWLIDQGINFPTQMLWIAGYFVISSLLATIACRRAYPLLAVAT